MNIHNLDDILERLYVFEALALIENGDAVTLNEIIIDLREILKDEPDHVSHEIGGEG